MRDIRDILALCALLVPYLLIGSFWAFMLGIPSGSIAWGAVLLFWPAIGLMLIFIAAVIASMLSGIIRSMRA